MYSIHQSVYFWPYQAKRPTVNPSIEWNFPGMHKHFGQYGLYFDEIASSMHIDMSTHTT